MGLGDERQTKKKVEPFLLWEMAEVLRRRYLMLGWCFNISPRKCGLYHVAFPNVNQWDVLLHVIEPVQ